MQDTPTSGGNSAAFNELFEQISGISEAVNSLDQCFSSLEAAATSNGSERNNNDHGRNRTLIWGGGGIYIHVLPDGFLFKLINSTVVLALTMTMK